MRLSHTDNVFKTDHCRKRRLWLNCCSPAQAPSPSFHSSDLLKSSRWTRGRSEGGGENATSASIEEGGAREDGIEQTRQRGERRPQKKMMGDSNNWPGNRSPTWSSPSSTIRYHDFGSRGPRPLRGALRNVLHSLCMGRRRGENKNRRSHQRATVTGIWKQLEGVRRSRSPSSPCAVIPVSYSTVQSLVQSSSSTGRCKIASWYCKCLLIICLAVLEQTTPLIGGSVSPPPGVTIMGRLSIKKHPNGSSPRARHSMNSKGHGGPMGPTEASFHRLPLERLSRSDCGLEKHNL